MEASKAAIGEFLQHGGKEHTEVDEHVSPAVTSETIKPHRHEEVTQAVDREVHQHHYHTTVQPVSHTETLPEKHTHNLQPVVQQEIHHGNVEHDKARLASEAAMFKNTSQTAQTTESTAKAPTVVGEHVHHHVHETVQPVIHKETVQPEVVHTTIPVHETHTAQSQHHGISTLPVRSLAEFESGGGKLTGGTHSHEVYEGHPKPYNPELQKHQYTGGGVQSSTADPSHQAVSNTTGVDQSDKRDIHNRDSGVAGLGGGAVAAGTAAGAGAASHHDHGASHGTGNVQNQPVSESTSHGSGLGGSAVAAGTAVGAAGAGAAATSHHDHTAGNTTGDVLNQPVSRGGRHVAGNGHGHVGPNPDLDRSIPSTTEAGSTAVASEHASGAQNVDNTGHGHVTGGSHTGETARSEGDAGAAVAHANTSHSDASNDHTSKHTKDTIAAAASNDESHKSHGQSEAETRPTEKVKEDEPKNLAGGEATQDNDKEHDLDKQNSSQGEDPSLVTEKTTKWTGEGVDGSHSAVFGLTPDGHQFDDTKNHAATSGLKSGDGESKSEDNKKAHEDVNKEESGAKEDKHAEDTKKSESKEESKTTTST